MGDYVPPVKTLAQLSDRLSGEIADGFAIVDRTLYTGGQQPYRTIELRSNSWRGLELGAFGEYPTTDTPIHFTPDPSVPYGTMAPVVEVLRRNGVVIDELR